MASGNIQENLARVRERIAGAAARAGRRADDITLIAVSKTHPPESIREAYEAGIRRFGENRVQEWEGKRGALADLKATWHLIGHLQSNKAIKAASLFDAVDSVDTVALAERLNRAREMQPSAVKLRVLIEVSVAREETKSGADAADVPELARAISQMPCLELAGLMCIPPFLEDAGKVRPYFRKLRELKDAAAKYAGVALPVLSMGMSHDFEVAIEEGATEVRVGTALFGARETKPQTASEKDVG